MPELSSSPLLRMLNSLRSEQSAQILAEHSLWGLKELSFKDDSGQRTAQLQKNIIFLDEFAKLNKAFFGQTNTYLTPLKGISLLTEIYGKSLNRPMTDIDVYTKLPEAIFKKIFLELGYEYQQETKWRFNQHKFLFRKQHKLFEITCEVHTELVTSPAPYSWQIDEYGKLAKDEEFLYLCYHWAEQHTCLKLFWLVDLYFFSQKYQLNEQVLWAKAKQLNITSSLLAARWALKNCFQIEITKSAPAKYYWKSFIFEKLLTPNTLAHIHETRGIYLVLKHLLKDSFYKQLIYNFLWLRQRYC